LYQQIISESQNESFPLTSLKTAAAFQHLSVKTIHHCLTVPEYPDSSQDGVAYIIDQEHLLTNIDFIQSDREEYLKKLFNDVQFCRREYGASYSTTSWLLGDVPVRVYHWKCTGVKHCEFLSDSLLEPNYKDISTEQNTTTDAFRATPELFELHREWRQKLLPLESEEGNAYWY
jgi:hypothetical protein